LLNTPVKAARKPARAAKVALLLKSNVISSTFSFLNLLGFLKMNKKKLKVGIRKCLKIVLVDLKKYIPTFEKGLGKREYLKKKNRKL
jgi:hypothetical protein